jgi:hypothetical protein
VVIAVIVIVWMVLGVGALASIGYGPLPAAEPRRRSRPQARVRS